MMAHGDRNRGFADPARTNNADNAMQSLALTL
jgi:hypothetical protein